MKRSILLVSLCASACGDNTAPDAVLQVRVPQDRRLLQSIATYSLRAERDSRVLAQQSTPANGSTLSLSGVPFGPRTVFTLDGITSAGDLVARGSSCPMDFEPHGDPVVIYFSPVNLFAPTPGAPKDMRMYPVALALATGNIVIAGGKGGGGSAVASAEMFSPVTGLFAVSGSPLTMARIRAEIIDVPGVGGFVVGGEDDSGAPLTGGDLYDVASQGFVPQTSSLLIARSHHKMVTMTNGHVLILGGRTSGNVPIQDVVEVTFAGSAARYDAGHMLLKRREGHAAAVVSGVPVVFGGTGDVDTEKTIEVLNVDQFVQPMGALLASPRVDATATTLQDGTVLLVGGTTIPNCGAELFNFVTGESTCFMTADLRTEHTATLLPDGRVLVTGGLDGNSQPLSSVELFVPGVGFVAERPLGTPRHGHVAVPLCDGTVLVTSGGAGAEIYNPPGR